MFILRANCIGGYNMQEKRIPVPVEVKTKLDEMTLLDRFLFNETVEDMTVYNDKGTVD